MEVIALRPLHSGEEIVNSYLNPSTESSSSERLQELETAWNFPCRCSICAGPDVSKSDARRRRITEAKQRIEESRGNPSEILKYAELLLDLMSKEGMVIPKGDYLELAAMASKYLGKRKEALKFARTAKKHWDVVMGEGSQESKAMVDFEKEV
ncbi:hypothetical protein B0T16DRAFT_409461 [Cercophora newfieldiana]|uniref:SET domain-containing protein n=1 Tax=Cercophora newfieldiana TaxID=92897 RepID=A0AA40CRW1_9PEZI|nr:hypothetical protein B0T16DRAFT_409461 [Cercophora newfieldiana]